MTTTPSARAHWRSHCQEILAELNVRGLALGDQMKKVSETRTRLLLELENIIGRECYNANTQNWGPNGVFGGEGRDFRYPITFIEPNGNKIKRKGVDDSLSPQVAITGHYAFGANQLQIIRALDKVVRHLEEKHNLSI